MRISPLNLTAIALATAMSIPADASGRHGRCEPAVDSELSRLQVDPARIGETSFQVRSHNNSEDNDRVDRVLAWVDLQDCTGRLVVELSPRCRVKQAYTTGACSVPGVPGY